MTTQTTTTPAVSPLMEIALRIREMRRITGFTEKEMAEKTGVTEAEYRSYETGTVDLPFTFLHKCSLAFGLELTDLLEGQSAKLSSYSVTRRGCGLITAAEDGITIRNMAALFRQKLATPYWVTYQYSEELQHQPIHTTTHGGQEFDLVLKGSMRVRVGDHEETLHEGDSIFYKSSTPHGMIAVDGADCTFLAMIMASTEEEQAIVVRPRAVEEVQPGQLLCSHFVQPVENEDGSLKELHFAHEDEFNFAFDIVDGIARRSPDKLAMLHVANDMTERRFTFKDMKDGSSQAANYFTSLGIKRGDRVMLVLKRHYQFWFAILGLHKLGAIAFVLVSVSLTDFYRVPWPVWRDMAEIYGHKYMTHAPPIRSIWRSRRRACPSRRSSPTARARAGTALTTSTSSSPAAMSARRTPPAAKIPCSCSSPPARPAIRRSPCTATNTRSATL